MTQPAARCADDNDLAAFVDGRLPAARRDALLAHLADCAACGAVAAGVARALDDAPTSAEPAVVGVPSLDAARTRRRPRLPALAVAAAVLVAVAAGVLVATRRPSDAPPVEGQVASAFAELAAARGDLFGGLAPMRAEELADGAAGVARGGLVAHAPVGTVLGRTPAFSWQPLPGAPSYTVVVRDAQGAVVWTKSAPGGYLPYPPDAPPLADGAAYAWSVEANGPLGRVEGRRAFSTADAGAASRWAETLREVKARVPEAVRALVAAEVALRRGYVVEAERLAVEQRRVADSARARDVERHVRRRLGHDVEPAPAPR